MVSKSLEYEARIDGLEAGRLNISAGANPYDVLSKEWSTWEHARSTVIAQRLALQAQQRTRNAICRYGQAECNCGGRGLCLDVA